MTSSSEKGPSASRAGVVGRSRGGLRRILPVRLRLRGRRDARPWAACRSRSGSSRPWPSAASRAGSSGRGAPSAEACRRSSGRPVGDGRSIDARERSGRRRRPASSPWARPWPGPRRGRERTAAGRVDPVRAGQPDVLEDRSERPLARPDVRAGRDPGIQQEGTGRVFALLAERQRAGRERPRSGRSPAVTPPRGARSGSAPRPRNSVIEVRSGDFGIVARYDPMGP